MLVSSIQKTFQCSVFEYSIYYVSNNKQYFIELFNFQWFQLTEF